MRTNNVRIPRDSPGVVILRRRRRGGSVLPGAARCRFSQRARRIVVALRPT
ncbi:hypothetical protein HMPREF3223_02156 [Cutibacterium avidum]|nr:hypothetical protein HMPREF3223_02156 [Cutibacterium avidum]